MQILLCDWELIPFKLGCYFLSLYNKINLVIGTWQLTHFKNKKNNTNKRMNSYGLSFNGINAFHIRNIWFKLQLLVLINFTKYTNTNKLFPKLSISINDSSSSVVLN